METVCYTPANRLMLLDVCTKSSRANQVFQRSGNSLLRFDRRRCRLDCRAGLAELAPLTAAVYGASLAGGGILAYTRTGSKGSLGGGVTGGVTLGLAFFLMQVPETKDLGDAIGFGAALLFAAVFGIRLAATQKPLPAGPLLVMSAAASVIFANAYFHTIV